MQKYKANFYWAWFYKFFYIATDKCTECIVFYDEPQCASVCPVDCCVEDEDNVETNIELLKKKEKLHS